MGMAVATVMFPITAVDITMGAATMGPSTVATDTLMVQPTATAMWTPMAMRTGIVTPKDTTTTAMVSTTSSPICSKERCASSMPRRCPSWGSSRS